MIDKLQTKNCHPSYYLSFEDNNDNTYQVSCTALPRTCNLKVFSTGVLVNDTYFPCKQISNIRAKIYRECEDKDKLKLRDKKWADYTKTKKNRNQQKS